MSPELRLLHDIASARRGANDGQEFTELDKLPGEIRAMWVVAHAEMDRTTRLEADRAAFAAKVGQFLGEITPEMLDQLSPLGLGCFRALDEWWTAIGAEANGDA